MNFNGEKTVERRVLGDAIDQLHIDEIQALVTADIEGSVSNFRLRQFLDAHSADSTKMLKGLREQELLQQDGRGRGASYRLNSRFGGSEAATGVSDNASGTADSATGIDGRASGVASPEAFDPTKDPTLLGLSQPARENKRLKPEQMQEIVRQLCLRNDLTTAQLANLLDRSADRVQRGYLKPMIDDGILKLKYPKEPTHSKQAYRASIQSPKGDV